MYPRLLELPDLPIIGSATIYTYGVLLAAAYLVGLKLAMVRAKARGLDQTRVLDQGLAGQQTASHRITHPWPGNPLCEPARQTLDRGRVLGRRCGKIDRAEHARPGEEFLITRQPDNFATE